MKIVDLLLCPFAFCLNKICCCAVIRRDIQQINALVFKSITLQLRHWCTNALQLSLPIFVLLTILLFQWLSDEIMQPMLQLMLPEDAGGEQESLDVSAVALDVSIMQGIVLSQNNSIPYQYLYTLDDDVNEGYFGTYGSETGILSKTPNYNTYYPYYTPSGSISMQKIAVYVKMNSQDDIDEELYDRLVEAQGNSSDQIKIIGGFRIHELSNQEFSYTLQYENEIERKMKPTTAVEMDAAIMGVDLNITKDSKTDFCKMSGYISLSFECENLMLVSLMNEMNHAYIMDQTNYHVTTKVSQIPFHREKYVIKMRYDESSGGYFFPVVVLLLLPVFAYNLVLEKENQIREMMKLMGLRTRNYVVVHVLSMFVMYVISQCVFIFLAYFVFRFRYFTETDPLLLFVIFFTCGLHLISGAFLMSSMVSSTLLATVLGYLVVLIAPTVFVTLGSLVSIPMNWTFQANLIMWKLLNFLPFYGICDLFYFSTKACIKMNCMDFMGLFYNYDMLFAFSIMNLMTIIYFILSFYLEAVFPQKWGVRKNPCFCFNWICRCCCWCCPCYWKNYCDLTPIQNQVRNKVFENIKKFKEMSKKKKSKLSEEEEDDDDDNDVYYGIEEEIISEKKGEDDFINGDEDEDVRNERLFIKNGRIKDRKKFGVIVNKLVKKYGSKLAVDKIYFKIPHGECFALLGPNGAGKTTCIRMLCGLFSPTSGEAYVHGKSIRRQMSEIWKHMGLCPQFDVQWPELTAREHLLFYARLKGVSPLSEQYEVDEILTKVGLQNGPPNCVKSILSRITGLVCPCEKKAKSLPLGERRRLSIGISLIGSPDILFLDEPTTGLDIDAKHKVWKLIEKEKKDKCVILTTHSMEEADILSDRIGIMARGRMKCVGNSFHLKSKFGTGFTLKVNYEKSKREELDEFINKLIPKHQIIKDFGDSITWEIELSEKTKISEIFKEIESAREDLGITDWAITQPTLEDVFLNIITEDEERYVLERDIARRKGEVGWKKWWQCWKWGRNKPLDDDDLMVIDKLQAELNEKLRMRKKNQSFPCLAQDCQMFFDQEIKMLNHFFESHEDSFDKLSKRQQFIINNQEIKDLKRKKNNSNDDDLYDNDEEGILDFQRMGDGNDKKKEKKDDDDEEEEDDDLVIHFEDVNEQEEEEEKEEDKTDSSDDDDEEEEGGEEVVSEKEKKKKEEEDSSSTTSDSSDYSEESEEEIVEINRVNLDENKRDFVGTIAYHYYHIFGTQCFFLTLKNILLTLRKWKSTCFQILIPVLLTFLLLLLYLLGKVDNDSTYVHPKTKDVDDFVKCKDWNGEKCYSLVYTTNKNPFAEQVIKKVISENSALEPYHSFATEETMLSYLSKRKNANLTQSAISFSSTESIVVNGTTHPYLDYTLYFNATTLSNPSGDTVSQVKQLKIAIDNAILSILGKGEIKVKLRGFPKIPIKGGRTSYDIYRSTGPMFLGLTAYFILSVALFNIVTEKSQKKSLRIVGMDNMAYWVSWFWVWIHVAMIAALVQVIIGLICWLPNFHNTNVIITFLYHFLYYVAIISIAPLLSVFLNNTKSTLLFSFIMVFIAMFMNAMLNANLIYSLFKDEEIEDIFDLEERMIPWIFSVLWPPFNYAKIYADIGFKTFPIFEFSTNEYKDNVGFGFADLFKMNYNKTLKIYSPATIYSFLFLILNMIIYLSLSWYFDNVFGERQSYWFFLTPSYWRINFRDCLSDDSDLVVDDGDEKKLSNFSEIEPNLIDYVCCNLQDKRMKPLREKPKEEDTIQEYNWIRGKDCDIEKGNIPILQCIDLIKIYSTLHFFKRKRAIQGINLGLSSSSCLVLLGPNGAGKSTLMDSISGVHSISAYSDIRVFGRSIKTDLPLIRPHFGAVDQYDLLWPDLTGTEHIILFSIFKPDRKTGIVEEMRQRLKEVGLWDDRGGRTKTYSGGMKRRLSVAIGMTGNPSMLLLDEPSTGVDPYSKRKMWNLIYKLKKTKGVLLTTHSMEEAEALSDRIAVMKDGRLLAIGDALYLKSRFGAGYTLNLEVRMDDNMSQEKRDEVKLDMEQWLEENEMSKMVSSEKKSEELYVLDIPPDFEFEKILSILLEVERKAEEEESIIKNWGISKKTLEQVYLKLMSGELDRIREKKEEEEKEKERRRSDDDDDSGSYNVVESSNEEIGSSNEEEIEEDIVE